MKKQVQKILNKFGYQFTKLISANDIEIDLGLNNEKNREKWLEKTIKNLPEGIRILDAGAGELKYKKLCTHLNYVSQDFGQYDGKGNNSGLQTKTWNNTKLDIVSDITCIPEPDNSFDAIMCIEVFEHLPAPINAIKEFARLLKSGGTLIITAPFASLTHFAPYHFYSGFNKYFYEKHLKDNEFVIDEISANGNYFEYIAQEIQFRIPSQYSNYTLNDNDKKIKIEFLNLLNMLNQMDNNSSDLLCFGLHIKATKL